MSSTINTVLERQEYPDLFQTEVFGPFSTITAGNFPLALVDQRTFVDGILVSVEVKGSSDTPQVSLWYAVDGQTMAAAVSAEQRLSGNVFVGTQAESIDALTGTDVAPESVQEGVPAGSRIFMRVQGTTTAVANLMWSLRTRNRIA